MKITSLPALFAVLFLVGCEPSVVEGPAGPAGPEGPVGPAGPAGPAGEDGADGAPGATGPRGPAGADGQDGISGYEVVRARCTRLGGIGSHGFQRAICPDGTEAVGGGVAVYTNSDCTSPSGIASITFNGLNASSTREWVGDVVVESSGTGYMQTQVICASMD